VNSVCQLLLEKLRYAVEVFVLVVRFKRWEKDLRNCGFASTLVSYSSELIFKNIADICLPALLAFKISSI